jgi:predicted Zn-dependent peptidase
LPEYKSQTIEVDKGTHQAHVMIGNRCYNIHDDRRMSLYLLNNIIGGPGMSARLNMSLREHYGLVYTVESTMVNYGDTGIWGTYFGCDPHDIKKCIKLVKKRIKQGY